jgi:hypothetical protein
MVGTEDVIISDKWNMAFNTRKIVFKRGNRTITVQLESNMLVALYESWTYAGRPMFRRLCSVTLKGKKYKYESWQ